MRRSWLTCGSWANTLRLTGVAARLTGVAARLTGVEAVLWGVTAVLTSAAARLTPSEVCPNRTNGSGLRSCQTELHTRLFTIIFSSSLLISENVGLLSGSCFQHRSMRLYLQGEKRSTARETRIVSPPNRLVSLHLGAAEGSYSGQQKC